MIGTLSIHPSVFYWFIVTTFLIFFSPKSWVPYKVLNFKKYTLLKLGVLALLLGGLWGSQSLTWGFVWVNDNIEWLLLYILIFLTYYLHSFKRSSKVLFFFLFLFYINMLLLLRLNFLPSRHSFLGFFKLNFFVIFFIFSIFTQFFFINLEKYLLKVSDLVLIFFWINFFFITTIVSISIFKYIFIFFSYYYFLKLVFTKFLLHFLVIILIFGWLNYINIFFLFFSTTFDLNYNFFIFEENVLNKDIRLLIISSLYTLLEQLSFTLEIFMWQTNHISYFLTNILCNNLFLLLCFSFICVL